MLELQSDDIFEDHRVLEREGLQVEEINSPIFNHFDFRDMENNQIRIHDFTCIVS